MDIWESRLHGGWLSDRFHYMSWAFSCLQLRSFYDEVELVTDGAGKALLIDLLGLPYSSFSVRLDEINDYDRDLWALGKLYTYSLQDKPFLHVDGDIFIWRPFDGKMMSRPVIGQHLELQHKYYHKVMKMVDDHLPYIPQPIADYRKFSRHINAVNAGLLGGNDVSFIRDYCREALSFVNLNMPYLHRIERGPFNCIYEQVLLYCMVHERKKELGLFTRTIGEKRINNEINHLYKLRKAPEGVDYIHLFGSNKRRPMYCAALAAQLKRTHRSYYDRIMDLTTAEIPSLQYA